ncbi:uncharacterized protein Dwil_GK21374 [Drosophila willistoni]|nr:uncharacterized protein Dwil_GK21374 [Drosophila willistoni]
MVRSAPKMYHNFVLVLLLLASGLCLINGLGNSGGNDYTWGTKTTASTLIADVIVTKTKSLMSTTTQTYALTQSGTALTITYIQITDLKKMRGATAAITSGGVGSTTVDVTFTSARGASIKSRIQIWGTS